MKNIFVIFHVVPCSTRSRSTRAYTNVSVHHPLYTGGRGCIKFLLTRWDEAGASVFLLSSWSACAGLVGSRHRDFMLLRVSCTDLFTMHLDSSCPLHIADVTDSGARKPIYSLTSTTESTLARIGLALYHGDCHDMSWIAGKRHESRISYARQGFSWKQIL